MRILIISVVGLEKTSQWFCVCSWLVVSSPVFVPAIFPKRHKFTPAFASLCLPHGSSATETQGRNDNLFLLREKPVVV